MKFELTVLGSNSALPKVNRFSTAQILNVSEQLFLIDCGEGTQIQLRRFKIKFSKINHIFISHLHGDHIYGLPGLISTFSLLGRKKNLHIYCHSSFEKILSTLLNSLEKHLNYKIIYHHTDTKDKKLIFENKIITVEAFPLKHKLPTTGFLFKEKQQLPSLRKDKLEFYNVPIALRKGIKEGDNFTTEEGELIHNSELTKELIPPRSFAFCSDTLYSEKTANYIKNVDLLYHEATFLENMKSRAKETMHSTAKDAAKVAVEANAKTLLIGHYSSRYNKTNKHIAEAKEVFENVFAVEDGFKFAIKINS